METKPNAIQNVFLYFSGRIGRLTYAAAFITIFFFGRIPINTNVAIESLGFAAFLWFLLAIAVKRQNDYGEPAWRLIGLLIPIVNIYVFFELFFRKGDEKDNKSGSPETPNPIVYVMGGMALLADLIIYLSQ